MITNDDAQLPPPPTLEDAHLRVPIPPWSVPMRPTCRVSHGLAGTLQGFLWAAGAFAVIAAGFTISCLVTFDRHMDARAESARVRRVMQNSWLEQDENLGSASALFTMLWIVVLVLLIIWMWKTHRASAALWSGSRRWSRGWTVGGWFIPLASLVIPKSVFDEIERILCARPEDRTVAGGLQRGRWQSQPTSALGWVWWFALVSGVLAWLFSAPLVLDDDGALSDPFQVRSFYVVRLMAFTCWSVSCVLGAFYVRRLTRAANQDGAGVLSTPLL